MSKGKNHFHQQQGFTLTELVVTIVILAILAVTAMPKFVDMQAKAKTTAIYGLAGSMREAIHLTHTRAVLDGVQEAEPASNATVTIDGQAVKLSYGYPQASHNELLKVITGLDDWQLNPTSRATNTQTLHYGFDGFDCMVTYTSANKQNEQIISAHVDITGQDCVHEDSNKTRNQGGDPV